MRKLPPGNSSHLRRALTIPNVLATIAVLAAAAVPAYAATAKVRMYTGANVRNSTIESRDIKNLSLASSEFSATTTRALKVKGDPGDAGTPGAPGPTGETGSTGAKGATGDKGTPAPRAFTFQTSAQTSKIKGNNPNPTGIELTTIDCQDVVDESDTMIGCTGAVGSPQRFPRWNYWCTWMGNSVNKHCAVTTLSVPQLSRSNQTLLVTSENASGGLLDMPYAGTIVLNATASFYTQRSGANQRLECQLQIARVQNGALQPAENVGVPITEYRVINPADLNQQERILNISVTAATAQPPGVYETQLACRAPDDNNDTTDRLEFIEGNMSVLSTRTNGQA